MGLRRFSNGRTSRKRGEEPSLFTSSSGSGDNREYEADRVDDESLVTRFRRDNLENKVEMECSLLAVVRRNPGPSYNFIILLLT